MGDTLKSFLKYTPSHFEIELGDNFNSYGSFTYSEFKKDLYRSLGDKEVLSWDACEYVNADGSEYTVIGISIDDYYITIPLAAKRIERINAAMERLSDTSSDAPMSIIDERINAVERLLPAHVWLDFNSDELFVLRYKSKTTRYDFPIEFSER